MISIKRLFSVFLCVFLLACLCVPALAAGDIRLDYNEWLWYYDLVDNTENHELWLGMYSYGGAQDILPIDVTEDEYNARKQIDIVNDTESETPAESDTDESVDASADSDSVDHSDSESDSDISAPEISLGAESSLSESPVLLAANVPTSGTSYTQPEMVHVEYAPDASDGSLLSVLYGLLGKPIVSYTYKVQTNYNNSQYGYVTEHLDYDSNWVCSLVLLLVVVFCIFKAGGALISKA